MPTYQPGMLGPVARDPEQKFWDPEIQTMPRATNSRTCS